MNEATKTAIKSVAVLLCIAIVSGLLLAVCNDIFYYEAGGMEDFAAVYAGNWVEAEKDETVALSNGTVSKVAEIGASHVGIIAVGNGYGKAGTFTVIAVIDRATHQIIGAKVLESGETASTYALTDDQLNAYKNIAIEGISVFDEAPDGALKSGATNSSMALKNAFMTIATYYAVKYKGASGDKTATYLGWLDELGGETSAFEKETVDETVDVAGGNVLLVAKSATSSFGEVVGFVLEKQADVNTGSGMSPTKISLSIVIGLSDSKVKAVKINEDTSTPMWAVTQTAVDKYVGKVVSTAKIFDSATYGLVDCSGELDAGATGSGYTQSSKIARSVFGMAARYFTAKYGEAKYLAMLNTWMPSVKFTKHTLDTTVSIVGGSIKYAATATTSQHGQIAAFVVQATTVGYNSDYTMLIAVDTATDKIVAAKIQVEGATDNEYKVPAEKIATYVGKVVTSATVFDNDGDGLVSGATGSSTTVRNAFAIVAKYYSAKKAVLSSAETYLSAAKTFGEGFTLAEVDRTVSTEKAYVVAKYVDGTKTVYVVVADGQGEASNKLVAAVLIDGATIEDVKLISSCAVDPYALSQSELKTYFVAGDESASVQSGATYTNAVAKAALIAVKAHVTASQG